MGDGGRGTGESRERVKHPMSWVKCGRDTEDTEGGKVSVGLGNVEVAEDLDASNSGEVVRMGTRWARVQERMRVNKP